MAAARGFNAAVGRAMKRIIGRVRAADARLARLADPSRCPDCGHKLAAGEDVITPHDCPKEG